MTCRDASTLLPRFLDGELDPRQMRMVALHGTKCGACEQELRQLEHLQELISDTVNTRVDEIDFASFWPGIERQLGTVRVSWRQWLSIWWGDGDHRWVIGVPAFAAAAVIALFAFLFFTRVPPSATQPQGPRVAAVDNAASIDSLSTDVDSVAVLNDPETSTTVLWVSDDTPTGGNTP